MRIYSLRGITGLANMTDQL